MFGDWDSTKTSSSGVSMSTVRLALEKEAGLVTQSKEQQRIFTPPPWMKSECLTTVGGNIGEEVKKKFGLRTLKVVEGGKIKFAA